MINFFHSKEFWIVTLILLVATVIGEFGNLANIVQNSGMYGWAYMIWRLEKHHQLLNKIKDRHK